MSAGARTVAGQVVDIRARRIFAGEIVIAGGTIAEIRERTGAPPRFLMPGFVDAHVHVESSMLPPCEFARVAVRHGTVATVSDPHEIANVLGLDGIEFMLGSAAETPFKFCFGAPSCVPATVFETAGAEFSPECVEALLERDAIGYLSEVMNYPGVLAGEPGLLRMIAAAKRLGKPVDGHAPGLRGEEARRYAAAGIQTDHECFALEEALDKIDAGMRIAIREGSAAKNYAALKPLLRTHPFRCMLCTDDLHPNALVEGHIDRLVAQAVADGADVFDALGCACLEPVAFYGLGVGTLRAGDPADFVVVEDLASFGVLETWIDGIPVARDGKSLLPRVPGGCPNRFRDGAVSAEDFRVPAGGSEAAARAIVARDGQLVTGARDVRVPVTGGSAIADAAHDILKIAVVSRYSDAPPAVAFVCGFGLREGAIASSVAHDSHNIVAVGATDEALADAVNRIIEARGGVCAVRGRERRCLPLPVAGLMSDGDGDAVALDYEAVAAFAEEMGSTLSDAFMTLSFMALLVIPDLKLSDRGLFSGEAFAFTPPVLRDT